MATKWTPYKKFQIGDFIPKNLRQKLREKLLFIEATGCNQMYQSPVGGKSYRYPAPISQEKKAFIPNVMNENDVYDVKYFTRNIIRFSNNTEYMFHPSIPEKAREIAINNYLSIPSSTTHKLNEYNSTTTATNMNKNTLPPSLKNHPVFEYDRTGTRVGLTATVEETNKLINKKIYENSHLVRYEWNNETTENEIINECKRKNIPPVPGRPFPWDVPTIAKIKNW